MNQPSIKTSLTEVTDKLPNKPPCRIFFKNEYLQPSGSFKLRGMGNLVSKSIETAIKLGKEKIMVYSSSGGNAGLAAAYSSKHYNLPCTVVLPTTSKPVVIEKLESFGAKVIVSGNHWGEADDYLRNEIIENLDKSVYPVYCHPFDDPLLWGGHGKSIDEIIKEKQLSEEELSKVKGVVCSVGGGGLYNGIVEGLARNRSDNFKDVPILAVETKQAPTFSTAVEAGKVVELESVNTLATSLASPYLSQQALDNYRTHKTYLGLIDDLEAVKGMIDYYDVFGTLVEPACGATLSVAFDNLKLLQSFGELTADDIVIFIVCGGSGANLNTLDEFRRFFR